MSKALRLLFPVFCLFVILGCKAFSNLSDSAKSYDQDKPNSTSRSSSTDENKLIGTWVGKSADGSSDLKMVFTENEFTLYSDGKIVAGTQKYTFKDEETLEVETRQGTTYPMKVSINGDILTVVMGNTKIKLRRES